LHPDFLRIREILLAFSGENRIFTRVSGGQIMRTKEKRVKLSVYQNEDCENLFETLGHDLKRNERLASHTTFDIGGEAEFFYVARRPEDLIRAIQGAREAGIAVFVLGGGSNVLVSDSGFKGLVIKNLCVETYLNDRKIACQSGAWLDDVVNLACENSLSGMEFAAGIPGTVGGAVFGNAGAFGRAVGDLLTEAVIITRGGKVERVERGYFEFGYRESKLRKTKDTLLSATFELNQGEREKIEGKLKKNLEERRKKLPQEEKSAGCFFRNVVNNGKKVSAGSLLEQIGAKKMRQGDAAVFEKHANILINSGKAKANDIRKLARSLKERVKDKFDIDLEEEVVYLS
jgi:UDP-N-acetylmuramate dehydrogenase